MVKCLSSERANRIVQLNIPERRYNYLSFLWPNMTNDQAEGVCKLYGRHLLFMKLPDRLVLSSQMTVNCEIPKSLQLAAVTCLTCANTYLKVKLQGKLCRTFPSLSQSNAKKRIFLVYWKRTDIFLCFLTLIFDQ